ncbi:MAG TPA: hypothetical protein VKC89_03415 [Patescibacteria group bacterium]|nr:hypothetical protein [Patescibacteria group bacterium]
MNLNKHFGYYVSLLAILIFGFLIAYNSSDKQFQFLIAVLTAFFYALWGVLHHLINHELNSKIVVEYTLMATLGIGFVFFLLKGGFGL